MKSEERREGKMQGPMEKGEREKAVEKSHKATQVYCYKLLLDIIKEPPIRLVKNQPSPYPHTRPS